MSREDIVVFLNKTIREEHGMPLVNGSDKLVETGVDSFGTIMVILALEDKYGVYAKDELTTVVVEGLTLDDIVNRVLDEVK